MTNNRSKLHIAALLFAAVIVIVIVIVNNKSSDVSPSLEQVDRPTTTYSPPTTTLFFAGDIMLGRHVQEKMAAAGNFALPFEKIADHTTRADLAFANLESPFLDSDNPAESQFVFRARPQAIEGLLAAGFDVLATVNNHTSDQGRLGIEFTRSHLLANGIIPIGPVPADFDPSSTTIEKNGIVFGFLSYTYGSNSGSAADLDIPLMDPARLEQDVWELRGHFADIVIVSMHAGSEYTAQPTQKQIDFARAAIDAGAELVIGHHPHWIQTIEQYKGKWIFYSLGNLVFDQMWSQETREGLTITMTVDNNDNEITITKIELLPVIIDDYCCPRFATAGETQTILAKIGLTSPVLFAQ